MERLRCYQKKNKNRNIPFGFSGIAQSGQGEVPAEHLVTEHYGPGSLSVILSRTFDNVNKIDEIDEKVLYRGIKEIRDFEKLLN